MKRGFFKRYGMLSASGLGSLAARAAVFFIVAALAAGTVMPVYGEEEGTSGAARTVITNIYHRHIGNSQEEGGCYTVPTEHTHQGDALNGGGCYQLPVPHEHRGDAWGGGGCYTLPVFHIHKGDEVNGGECYQETEHIHMDDCYQAGICVRTFVKGNETAVYDDQCFAHGTTSHVEAECTIYHDKCELGVQERTIKYCQICGYMPQASHEYQETICGKTTDYVRSCGKEEGVDTDGYETECGFAPGQTESYELSCGITTEGYGLSCGLTEEEPCGRIILSYEPLEEGAKARISVSLEELSKGALVPGENPYAWQDQNGNSLGNGEQIVVEENGNYSVTVSLENKDVDEGSLRSSILVEGITKEKPDISPSASASPEETPSASPVETPSASPEEIPSASPEETPSASPEEIPSASPEKTPAAIPTQAPNVNPTKEPEDNLAQTPETEPTEMPDSNLEGTPETDSPENSGANTGTGENAPFENPASTPAQGSESIKDQEQDMPSLAENAGAGISNGKPMETTVPSASPQSPSPLKKETYRINVKENEAEKEIPYNTAEKEKTGIAWILNALFRQPAVRIITITTGSLLLLAGIFFLLLYLRQSARIYNDDGQGKWRYLGRAMVRRKEAGYMLFISQEMEEQAYTNRYCIKPGLFLLGKKKGQEIVIHKGKEKLSMPLSRKMIVVI